MLFVDDIVCARSLVTKESKISTHPVLRPPRRAAMDDASLNSLLIEVGTQCGSLRIVRANHVSNPKHCAIASTA